MRTYKGVTWLLSAFGQRVFLGIVLLLTCFLALPAAYAQYDNGSAVGTIHDSTGAPIPGASVKITNTETGIVNELKSNGNGDYEAPSLHVGVYTIDATAPGFSQAIAKNITISVGGRQRIDLTLNVGSTSETVEVSDVALQIQTESSERSQTITNYQSEALPLVTRNYADLLGLVAGSRQAGAGATTTSINSLVRAGSYNINGQRSMFNNFLLDGLDNNAYGESNQGFDNQIVAVPPDSVSQFQTVTNNESAEYGRSSGATVNVATLSGTNKFHGTLYEFIRNTDLNAVGFFKPNTVSNTGAIIPFQKPKFNRNQFGMNFGGPILKDRFFFFLDYEGFRQVQTPLSVLTLPTQDELNGKLVVDVQNPVTGGFFPKNTPIPTSLINPLSLQIVNAFKKIGGLPQSGAPGTGLAQNDYPVQVPFTDNSDKGDLRLDFQQNASSSWFLRISDRKENAVNAPPIPLPLDGQSNGNIRVLDQQVALGYTHLFGSNKILDARIGLSRTKAGKYTQSIGTNLGYAIPGLPSNPVVAGGLPSIGINGFTSFGRQSTNPQWQNPALLDPKINFTYVKGNHSMKFGYEYEHVWMAVNDNNPLYGGFTYNGGFSNAGGTTVNDTFWADFLFGLTNNYQLANYFVVHLRQTLQSAYAQDDWKVLPNLTLNLGVRWEYGSPYSEQNNFVSNFDPITQTVLTITPGAVAGNGITPVQASGTYGKTLMDPDLNDFAPRVGFSYAPDAKTAIRGGFGMSFVHYTRAGSGDILAINAPQAQFASVNQSPLKGATTPALPHCNPVAAQNCYVTSDQGFPATLVTSFNPATDNITWVPRNTRDSYVESYFLSVQRTLAKNTLLDIAYVGNHGLKLQGFLNANQKNPSNGFLRPYGNWPSDITAGINEFMSNYNALQIKYEQRSVAGLTLLNSFTWSHALDNAAASLEANTPSPQDANNISADYGQSDYNLPISDVTSIVYEMPFGHGRQYGSHINGVTDAVIGGWQLSLINTMQAGTPFNLTYSPSATNAVSSQINATYRGANEYRPNVIPGVKQILNTQIASNGFIQYVNPAAFALPATTVNGQPASPFGNASRNPLRNTAFYQTDLTLNKKFATPIESLKVEFRSEFYNILNHTNLTAPGTIGGTLGATASTGGQISSTFSPRIIQFGAKLLF